MTSSANWFYDPDGRNGIWRILKFAAQHRFNAGIIVDSPMLDVRFRNGRKLGKVEEGPLPPR